MGLASLDAGAPRVTRCLHARSRHTTAARLDCVSGVWHCSPDLCKPSDLRTCNGEAASRRRLSAYVCPASPALVHPTWRESDRLCGPRRSLTAMGAERDVRPLAEHLVDPE